MTTAREIVTSALRKIRVLAVDETPDGDELSDGVAALNRLLHSLDDDHTDLAPGGTFPLDAKYEDPFIYVLGDRLAEDYATTAPNQAHVMRARNLLTALFFTHPTSTVDAGLLDMPSQRNAGNAGY